MSNVCGAVILIVKNNEGQFLAVARRNDHNDFGFPGGKVDKTDRTPLNALVREVKEETGHIMINPKLLGCEPHAGHIVGVYTCGLVLPEGSPRPGEPPVKWASRTEIVSGSAFGRWNAAVLSKYDL